MKKILTTILLALLVIMASACGKEKTANDSEKDSKTESESSEASKNDDEEEEKKERYIEEVAARYHAKEENGYSIWSSTQEGYFCVDYEGYITFRFDENEENLTSVHNDVLLTETDGEVRLRKAKDGKILFTTSSVEDLTILVPYYYGESMFEDGYILAYTKTEAYNGVSYKLGFLDSTGEWIQEISENNPILTTIGEEAAIEYFDKQLLYSGEGIMAFETNNGCYLYNINTNTVSKIQSSSDLSESDISGIVNCGIKFKDGIAFTSYGTFFGNQCYKIYSDGRTEMLPLNFSDKLHEEASAKYYDAEKNRVLVIGHTYHEDSISVFASDGEIVKKIENVTVLNVNGFTEEGTAQIVFENKDGSKYYTVIDAKGEFLFEPIKMTENEIWDLEANYIECEETHSVRQGKYAIVDNVGVILLQTEWVYNFGVNNGVASYEEESNGDRVYVDLKE